MDSSCENFEIVPKTFWHLDPVTRVYAKLFIQDILHLKEYPTGEGAFAYKNHPITKVDIIGWVVRVEERQRLFQYAVDDGTGVINCCCWKPKRIDMTLEIADTWPSSFGAAVSSKLQEHDSHQLTCMELGDTIHVRGRLKWYRHRLEVSASYFRKIEDPACLAEIYRMEELPKLYEKVYDRPFVLPNAVVQHLKTEKEEKRTGLTSEAHLIDRLCRYLQSYLTEKSAGISNFHLNELETLDGVMEIASSPCLEYKNHNHSDSSAPVEQIRSIIKQAVQKLDEDGVVYRSGVANMYEVLTRGSHSRLDQTILEILRRDCQLTKYENGCHYMHVMDCLHNHGDFQNVTANSVRLALLRLEEQSDVISTTSKHFIPVS